MDETETETKAESELTRVRKQLAEAHAKLDKRPPLGKYLKINFKTRDNWVVFYPSGPTRWRLPPTDETDAIWERLVELYETAERVEG